MSRVQHALRTAFAKGDNRSYFILVAMIPTSTEFFNDGAVLLLCSIYVVCMNRLLCTNKL